MKLVPVIRSIVLAVVLFSCGGEMDVVEFESAQPLNVKAEKRFKNKVTGVYKSCDSEEILTVSDKMIVKESVMRIRAPKTEVNFDTLSEQEWVDLIAEDGGGAIVTNDSVFANFICVDTIYLMSPTSVLKKRGGSYYLNENIEENRWRVSKMNIVKDSLWIGEISPSDSLLKYEFASEERVFSEEDSVGVATYVLNPTKKEFKKLVRSNTFEKTECFYKVE